jgi:hypothetical protein
VQIHDPTSLADDRPIVTVAYVTPRAKSRRPCTVTAVLTVVGAAIGAWGGWVASPNDTDTTISDLQRAAAARRGPGQRSGHPVGATDCG